MGTQLEIVVAGHWLSMEMLYGDVTMSTIWPGGSDQLSWTPAAPPARRFTGAELVVAYYGGMPVWAGSLDEPDASQEQMSATGAWREGENFAAIDGSGNASKAADTVIDQAITRGLRWTRAASIATGVSGLDISQGPVKVSDVLDRVADNNQQRWGVDPYRQVFKSTDPVLPSYQTVRVAGGSGYSLDGYASTLIARYLDSTTSTYKTVTVTDSTAEALHGHVEQVLDFTNRGSLASSTVNDMLTRLLALGRSTPRWTASLEFTYGEVLSMGGLPFPLEAVAAGDILRVNGGYELAQRLNGAMYIDVLIGQTSLSGGVLTIQPLQKAARSLADVLTLAVNGK